MASYHTITHDDRVRIKEMLDLKLTRKEIAQRIGCSERALYYEIKKGSYQHLSRHHYVKKYDAYRGDTAVTENKSKRGRKKNLLKGDNLVRFVEYLTYCIKERNWSPAAALRHAKREGIDLGVTCCTSTLYKYIYDNLIPGIRKENLLLQGKQKKRKKEDQRPKHTLHPDHSIDDRPKKIDTREEFGHWETDCVLSCHGDPTTLLVMTERKTRAELVFKIWSKSQSEVNRVFDYLEGLVGPVRFPNLFKTVTVDNGSEFGDPDIFEKSIKYKRNRTTVYYCHAYSSWERGSNENANKLVRRKAKKGSSLRKLTNSDTKQIQTFINTLPRKILDWACSWELFEAECKKINVNTALFS